MSRQTGPAHSGKRVESKAEKVSGDARAAPSQPDNTDMFAGVHGTTCGRAWTEGRAGRCPLLEVRGSRLRLLPFASSYLVRSRARRSPAGRPGVQPSGAGHPHSPDPRPAVRRHCDGTLLREGRRPTPAKRPRGLPQAPCGRMWSPARGLGNGKITDPASKPLTRASPRPSRPGCRGSRASLPSLSQGHFVLARPFRFSLPKNLPRTSPGVPKNGAERSGQWARHRAPEEPPFQSPTAASEDGAWGELSSSRRLQNPAYPARPGRCAGGPSAHPSRRLRVARTRRPRTRARPSRARPDPRRAREWRENDVLETGRPRLLGTESGGADRAGKRWRPEDPAWVAGLR